MNIPCSSFIGEYGKSFGASEAGRFMGGGFAMEQTIAHFQLSEREIFFWAVHSGAELDLLFRRKGKLYGVEFKYNEAPRLTPSMRSAHKELSLAHLWVIYPGTRDYVLDKKTSVVSLRNLRNIFI